MSWFEIYLGFGVVAVLVTMLWRFCRPSGASDTGVVLSVFGSHEMGALLVFAAWPLVIPYVLWSYRRSRKSKQFIREDETWPRNSDDENA
jgi:hypothetical protein